MTAPPSSHRVSPAQIQEAHQLYCRLTGQELSLRFDRERLWFDLLREGYTLDDIAHLIGYLQREIRHHRRNVGSLKLSNLLQPDRFEEDLNLSRLRLKPPAKKSLPPSSPLPPTPPDELERGRQKTARFLQQLKNSI